MNSLRNYFLTAQEIDKITKQGIPKLMPLMEELWPICRSITGNGVRQTLDIIEKLVPLSRTQVATGTKCLDWEIPKEWNIYSAYIKDPNGRKIVDFDENNLHVLGYSIPVHKKVSLEELKKHIYYRKDYPDAIPYRTSYYEERWGFCMSAEQASQLKEGEYEVYIDSTLESGFLDYAESQINLKSEKKIFFSSYLCHPSMANNELSGITVWTILFSILARLENLSYSYHGLLNPETVGSIAFLSQNYKELQNRVEAGFVISCVGDDGPFTYVSSRSGKSKSDIAAFHVMTFLEKEGFHTIRKNFNPCGSDERQYCSIGIDLPIGAFSRSKYGDYKEYHTSKDNLDFVSEEGLQGSLIALLRIIQTLELDCYPLNKMNLCEPQLGKRGLYPTLSGEQANLELKKIKFLVQYSDGKTSLIEIANKLDCPIWDLTEPLKKLVESNIIDLKFPS